MNEELKKICDKYLVKTFFMGQRVKPMSAECSEYYLPMIDHEISPKMVKEILLIKGE